MYPNTVNELSMQKNLRFSELSAISTWKMYKNTISQKKFDIFSQCMLLSKEIWSETQGLEKGKREGEATQGQEINEHMDACTMSCFSGVRLSNAKTKHE